MRSGGLHIYSDDWNREFICVYLYPSADNEYYQWHWVYVLAVSEKWIVHEDSLAKLEVVKKCP
jgi:hypothetical protein